jgi:hypothetical protein
MKIFICSKYPLRLLVEVVGEGTHPPPLFLSLTLEYPHHLALIISPAPDKYLTLKICINVGRAYWVVVVNDDFRYISHGRVVFRDVQYQNQLGIYDFDGNKLTVIYKRCMCRVF